MLTPIYITAISSISAIGNTSDSIWENYKNQQHFITEKNGNLVSELSQESKSEILKLRASNVKYKSLDDSVLFAMFSARRAMGKAGWNAENNFGINIGSSRGATSLFEDFHGKFLKKNKAETLSSPTTTLGNISSWVAQDLQTQGPQISHSVTCSTALHALLNGVAWLQSGLCDMFLVGGSEAPLTPFTIAQMQALKIYGKQNSEFPCRALDLEKKQNTMVLGEGAAMATLEKSSENAIATIKSIGYATEILEHNVSLSINGDCFIKSMTMALGDLNPDEVDVIVTHTPGTIKGDQSEINAINNVFGKNHPALTTNKWKLGHTLGASGMLSIEMAALMLQKQEFISVPFIDTKSPNQIKNILINAVGFGGNAVSILLSK